MLLFWLLIITTALLATLIEAIVRYKRAERHEPRPLSEEERHYCAQIVDAGLDTPWICRAAVDNGACPCLPCSLLEKAKRDDLPYIGQNIENTA